jgi:hypothetical protein
MNGPDPALNAFSHPAALRARLNAVRGRIYSSNSVHFIPQDSIHGAATARSAPGGDGVLLQTALMADVAKHGAVSMCLDGSPGTSRPSAALRLRQYSDAR